MVDSKARSLLGLFKEVDAWLIWLFWECFWCKSTSGLLNQELWITTAVKQSLCRVCYYIWLHQQWYCALFCHHIAKLVAVCLDLFGTRPPLFWKKVLTWKFQDAGCLKYGKIIPRLKEETGFPVWVDMHLFMLIWSLSWGSWFLWHNFTGRMGWGFSANPNLGSNLLLSMWSGSIKSTSAPRCMWQRHHPNPAGACECKGYVSNVLSNIYARLD